MTGRNDRRRNPLENYQQIEIDSMKLAVVVFKIVEKVNHGFKFTVGDGMTKDVAALGADVRRAVKYVSAPQKVKYLSRAKHSLEELDFLFEVAFFGGIISDEDKVKYDIEQGLVSGQLKAFLSSQSNKMAYARRSPGASNSPGAISE